ncbi:hypothetical protein SCP_1403640 [Sparassis crispa]|uniref:EF-hand domain-containing protein n=1 Tax=Sparassis crispa TaxID=139825 RepID=A0A401H3D9_9APHY|nr:hypothetical protein SCP_1403640 [Sparassis crispa]GBE88956.1 hypothetical protein SCP_1403640 [Sparassis crispa]
MPLSHLFRTCSLKSFMGHKRKKSALPAPLPLAASAVTFPSSELPSSEIAAAHSTSPASAALSDSTVPTIPPWTPPDSPSQSMPEAVVSPSPDTSSPIPQECRNGLHANRLHLNTTSDSSMSDVSVSTTDDDRVMRTLTVVSAQINKHGSSSKAEQALNALDDKVTTIQDQETLVTTLYAQIEPAVALEAVSGVKKSIEDGINLFLDGMPVLMKALDEVAEIHPFVQAAVLAFKAVLETKRQANDAKITALYVEMKDMIAVLIQLKNVKDVEDVGPGGITLKGRLQNLVKTTANDMKKCANACDAYSKLLVKILTGPLWENKLADFVSTFTERRTQFEFTLSIHIGRGVDEVKRKLDNLEHGKNMLLKFMRTYVPPEQRELVALVQKKGGTKAVMDNEEVLKELHSYGSRRPTKAGDTQNQAGHARGEDDFIELKSDLQQDPDEAVEKNLQTFERKFEMQKRQLIEEVERVVKRESDRIIDSVTSGPHDKVVDRGWRGTVEARHFVLALRHYYHEKTDGKTRKESATKSVLTPDPDAWALEYLSVKRLQSIIDALDEDAAGFITVAEANKLTEVRPLNWSLLHWIAYWAVGWRINATIYIRRINELVGKMFAIKEEVYATNGPYVDEYLHTVWAGITSLTCSMRPMTSSDNLQARFKSRMDAEEERIRTNLEAVRYNINDMETLSLITGPGTIEKVRAFSSIDIFKQQKLDLDQQFKTIWGELVRIFFTTVTQHGRSIFSRYIQLSTRKYDFGRPLEGDEEDELTRCRKSLTPTDARFYLTLYLYQFRTTAVHFGVLCDNCIGVIGGTRTICIDCRTDRAVRTVDICQDERCLSAEVRRSDLASPHLPSHAVYKVRRTVHDREFGQLDKEARVALQNARAALKDAAEVKKKQTKDAAKEDDRRAKLVNDKLKCIVCKKRVVRPCWLCMTCRDELFWLVRDAWTHFVSSDVYICLNCDPTDGITIEGHDKRHPLVRYQEEVAAKRPSRIEALERKLDAVDGKIARVDERIQQLLQMMTMGARTPSTVVSISAEETE